MKKSQFTESQIAFVLKQAETGTPVAEMIRKMGISEQTLYNWKMKYGDLGVSELRRLKQLEEENRQLKNWWPISLWISRCCRTCCEKSSEACSLSGAGFVSSGELPGERAPCLLGSFIWALFE